MKVHLALIFSMPFILLLGSCERLEPNEHSPEIPVFFRDNEFLKELIDDKIDTNGDGSISQNEAESVTFLNLSNY